METINKQKNLKEVAINLQDSLPKGKHLGYPCYIFINERLGSVSVSAESTRWKKRAEKEFEKLGYKTDLLPGLHKDSVLVDTGRYYRNGKQIKN